MQCSSSNIVSIPNKETNCPQQLAHSSLNVVLVCCSCHPAGQPTQWPICVLRMTHTRTNKGPNCAFLLLSPLRNFFHLLPIAARSLSFSRFNPRTMFCSFCFTHSTSISCMCMYLLQKERRQVICVFVDGWTADTFLMASFVCAHTQMRRLNALR